MKWSLWLQQVVAMVAPTTVMSNSEINKAVSQWLLTFNLCVSVTWPLTCAFHILCTPEIIDLHRGACDNDPSCNQIEHALSTILVTIMTTWHWYGENRRANDDLKHRDAHVSSPLSESKRVLILWSPVSSLKLQWISFRMLSISISQTKALTYVWPDKMTHPCANFMC